MQKSDKIFTLSIGIFVAAMGVIGGIYHWSPNTYSGLFPPTNEISYLAYAPDYLPFLIWFYVIPIFILILSSRVKQIFTCVVLGTSMGLLFIISSSPFYFDNESIIALIITLIVISCFSIIAVYFFKAKEQFPVEGWLFYFILGSSFRVLFGFFLFSWLWSHIIICTIETGNFPIANVTSMVVATFGLLPLIAGFLAVVFLLKGNRIAPILTIIYLAMEIIISAFLFNFNVGNLENLIIIIVISILWIIYFSISSNVKAIYKHLQSNIKTTQNLKLWKKAIVNLLGAIYIFMVFTMAINELFFTYKATILVVDTTNYSKIHKDGEGILNLAADDLRTLDPETGEIEIYDASGFVLESQDMELPLNHGIMELSDKAHTRSFILPILLLLSAFLTIKIGKNIKNR